jgi:hypothetical protein
MEIVVECCTPVATELDPDVASDNARRLLASGFAQEACAVWLHYGKETDQELVGGQPLTTTATAICEMALANKPAKMQLGVLFIPLFSEYLSNYQSPDITVDQPVAEALTVLLARSDDNVIRFRESFSNSEWAQRLKMTTQRTLDSQDFTVQRTLAEIVWRFVRIIVLAFRQILPRYSRLCNVLTQQMLGSNG